MKRRTKQERWEDNHGRPSVHEPPPLEINSGGTYMRGRWAREVFGRRAPLTLEIGCGHGEYCLALARRDLGRNVIGIDIKSHRFWLGAKTAEQEGLQHVAFLRGRAEFIERFFAPGEVSEIWLTFSEPQLRNAKGTKRITSRVFLERYRRVLTPGGLVHIKTDSELIYERALAEAAPSGFRVTLDVPDVDVTAGLEAELVELLGVQTKYERKWRERGIQIRYLRLEALG
ncbi:MAG: tRNA (guanosine(46)-N7)-methyltransferase TrmB [Planctomycetota bacterium]|nr:tRNA (guanosine(46)-N7)-methyltransferase TrmB [Planctomycetota bacterium]